MCHLNVGSLGLCGYQSSLDHVDEPLSDLHLVDTSAQAVAWNKSALFEGHTYEWYEVIAGGVLSTIINIAESILNKITACCGIKEDSWYIQPKDGSLSSSIHEIDEVSEGM